MQRSQIFKYIYSNLHTIFNTNIYLEIRLCQIFDTNIFGHLFVYLFMQIYSEICSCQSSYKCHILIQAHLANLSSDPGEGTLLINSSAPARKTDCRVPLSYCGTSECFLLWRSWLPFLTFTLSHFHTFSL